MTDPMEETIAKKTGTSVRVLAEEAVQIPRKSKQSAEATPAKRRWGQSKSTYVGVTGCKPSKSLAGKGNNGSKRMKRLLVIQIHPALVAPARSVREKLRRVLGPKT